MRGLRCAVCGAGFAGRSDAVYCSPACRQKAHRARTARRVDALRERARQKPPLRTSSQIARSVQQSAARSIERAREQLDRSRELVEVAERELQEGGALRRGAFTSRPQTSGGRVEPERARWRGV